MCQFVQSPSEILCRWVAISIFPSLSSPLSGTLVNSPHRAALNVHARALERLPKLCMRCPCGPWPSLFSGEPGKPHVPHVPSSQSVTRNQNTLARFPANVASPMPFESDWHELPAFMSEKRSRTQIINQKKDGACACVANTDLTVECARERPQVFLVDVCKAHQINGTLFFFFSDVCLNSLLGASTR